ncbi:MAG: hypothetical protein HFI93_08100 [Lachnospiraceae bacterium]|nr:hypothetical protein [Lachnospiraceae bacterium]
MRERINRLAKGFIDYGKCEVKFSRASIEEEVTAGSQERGAFHIFNEENVSMKGLVYSTNRKVRVWDNHFIGTSCEIRYEVNAQNEEPGSVLEGCFQIVSSYGEYQIPYAYRVDAALSATAKILDSLDAFAELARTEDGLALNVFASPEFVHFPFMRERPGCRVLYEGLTGRGSRRVAMEEFLTGIGAKEVVRLSVDTSLRQYGAPEYPTADRLRIERNTWGYVRIEVSADTPFIQLEKKVLLPDDFEENVCYLEYTVAPAALHPGRNCGRIFLKTIREEFVIPCEARAKTETDKTEQIHRQEYLNYVDLYLNYQAGNRGERLLLNGMQTELSRMRSSGQSTDLEEMFHAEVFLLQGRKEQAGLLLEDARLRILSRHTEDVETYCYYLYVKTLYREDPAEREALIRVLNQYSESAAAASPVMSFLTLRLDPALNENASLKLAQMKAWYRQGSRSPFLYLEGCRILNETPELLRVMEGFELQILVFGARRDLVNEKLAKKAAALAQQEKGFRPLYYRMLAGLYETYPNVEVLGGICSLLMKGDKREPKYFTWYQRGVETDIRLTRLYEYYLYTLPEDFAGELPRMLLLYFSYNHTLDYQTRARLYAYVLEHCEADEALAENYRRKMEEFAMDQLFQGHISPDLAKLYRAALYPDIVDGKIAKALPKLLYTRSIRCENPGMRYVVVCYEELKGEVAAPLRNGQAYVPVYSEDARILFQDGAGNRYESAVTVSASLMREPELEEVCRDLNPRHEMMELAACRRIRAKEEKTEEEMLHLQGMLTMPDIHPEYKKVLLRELVAWYEKHPAAAEGDSYLLGLDAALLEAEDRALLLNLLIARDYIPEAYQILERYGCGRAVPSQLMKLCSRMIVERLFECDPNLLGLSFICLKEERADSVILEYLSRYYNGSSGDMFRILRSAREVHAQTFDLEERLLGQMLFTGYERNLDEAFRAYVEKDSCDEGIVNAYLVVKSYRYFLQDESLGSDLAAYMKKRAKEAPDVTYLPLICLMALTRYDSTAPELSAEECGLCKQMLEELYRKGYVFAYYRELARFVRLPEELNDKLFLEYRGSKTGRVQIRWRVLPEEKEEIETMPHMYEGIFVKQIPVFYGETLEYEIFDPVRGKEPVKKECVRFCAPQDLRQASRTAMINRILEAAERKDETVLKEAMLEYGTRDGLVGELFTPI